MNDRSSSSFDSATVRPEKDSGMRASAKLNVHCAGDSKSSFVPKKEFVEGLLTEKSLSLVYGPSNAGKTFLAVDLAASVCDGINWLGRRTTPGTVVYLAAESADSVRLRIDAIRKHKSASLEKLLVIEGELNLFNDEECMKELFDKLEGIEASYGAIKLIIGDTFAMLCPAANENSAQDVGQVISNINRIKSRFGAHFCLIHHTGKENAGSRGSSALPAAVDTEMEVKSHNKSTFCQVRKQRDLATKGQIFGFVLESVETGINNTWGNPLTTCIVHGKHLDSNSHVPQESAAEFKGIKKKILDELKNQATSITKGDFVKLLVEKLALTKSCIYRDLNLLAEQRQIHYVEDKLKVGPAPVV